MCLLISLMKFYGAVAGMNDSYHMGYKDYNILYWDQYEEEMYNMDQRNEKVLLYMRCFTSSSIDVKNQSSVL
ncbi:hypothetical protein WN943_020879 [Citrus x changshan-huyou]